jgi:hypothetical protein
MFPSPSYPQGFPPSFPVACVMPPGVWRLFPPPPPPSPIQPRAVLGDADYELQFVEISCWLQPFPEQVLLEGELCWTSHYHSAYGTMEYLDHHELGRSMRYNRLLCFALFCLEIVTLCQRLHNYVGLSWFVAAPRKVLMTLSGRQRQKHGFLHNPHPRKRPHRWTNAMHPGYLMTGVPPIRFVIALTQSDCGTTFLPESLFPLVASD